ncbi:MAG TPA: twin-arginine translocase TatA/TatE family subunit [Bacteroidetes bacterium]|nr:twin-arginine translocase TatA/TatE family subunit [Bacteroidota bacterium]
MPFSIGMSELMLIMVLALLLFGPNKLPEFARGIARAINNFKRAAEDVKQELNLDDFDKPRKSPFEEK